MGAPKLTERQRGVLGAMLRRKEPVGSENSGSVLHALHLKGLVRVHHNSAPGYTFYTWTLTDEGRAVAEQQQKSAGCHQ